MHKCKHVRYDCSNFHAFIKKITQRFCTTPPFYSKESRRKQISIGWKSEATEATQACKQQPWLPLWLSVSLTALLIHLRHNTQQTQLHDPTNLSLKTFYFRCSPTVIKIMTFGVKMTEIAGFWRADIKGKTASLGHRDLAVVCVIFHGVFSLALSSLLCITLTKDSHTHIHPLHQCDRQGDKMAEWWWRSCMFLYVSTNQPVLTCVNTTLTIFSERGHCPTDRRKN